MPTERDATALKNLVDPSGAGNVTALSRQEGRYRSVWGTEMYTPRVGTVNQSLLDKLNLLARRWAGLALTSIAANVVQ
jgi:hypothetical protein